MATGMSKTLPTVLGERPVQLRGSRIAQAALRAAGWRLQFDGLPAKQGVLIVYPHTSNWDFVAGIVAKWGMGLPVVFFGKDTLFKTPLLGPWLRWLGGMPIDRSSAKGVVPQMAERLRQAREGDEFLWVVLAPEGTRSYLPHWRSGFFQLALQADVPLGLAFIDYPRKEIGTDSFLKLTGDTAASMAAIAERLSPRKGLRPEQAAPIRLQDIQKKVAGS
jgi:1-acyl-sn-glycerol-3-phosphate acyltransferase